MVIRAYGLFWRCDEVNWHPGRGNRRAFRLLGRRGSNRPGIRLADFRDQVGIYVLYGNYGPHYVGLTRDRGIGQRLKDHLCDEHGELWGRFSWFGFRSVLKQTDADGLCRLRELATVSVGNPNNAIGDMEALLIKAMGLRNKADMKFQAARDWKQVKRDEVTKYLDRL
jgi:hypothetical protein